MIITRTPYRISFFGGGSDYPQWYKQHGGAVLAATINKYCWIAVRPPTKFGPKFKVVYSKVEEVDDIEKIEHPAVRECLRHCGFAEKGCEVHHWSDLPARSGMGSSSAFVVGLLKGLQTLNDSYADPKTLMMFATYIEQDILKETVGSQDQAECAYGGLNHIVFYPAGDIDVSPALTPGVSSYNTILEFSDYLLLFYTGVQRTASDVASGYVEEMCKNNVFMEELIEMVDTGRVALQERDFREFGFLLREGWEVKRGLKGVTSAKIDEVYTAALNAGALGGKILGAGGGGFLLVFAESSQQASVREALKELKEVPFEFDNTGSVVVYDGDK